MGEEVRTFQCDVCRATLTLSFKPKKCIWCGAHWKHLQVVVAPTRPTNTLETPHSLEEVQVLADKVGEKMLVEGFGERIESPTPPVGILTGEYAATEKRIVEKLAPRKLSKHLQNLLRRP